QLKRSQPIKSRVWMELPHSRSRFQDAVVYQWLFYGANIDGTPNTTNILPYRLVRFPSDNNVIGVGQVPTVQSLRHEAGYGQAQDSKTFSASPTFRRAFPAHFSPRPLPSSSGFFIARPA